MPMLLAERDELLEELLGLEPLGDRRHRARGRARAPRPGEVPVAEVARANTTTRLPASRRPRHVLRRPSTPHARRRCAPRSATAARRPRRSSACTSACPRATEPSSARRRRARAGRAPVVRSQPLRPLAAAPQPGEVGRRVEEARMPPRSGSADRGHPPERRAADGAVARRRARSLRRPRLRQAWRRTLVIRCTTSRPTHGEQAEHDARARRRSCRRRRRRSATSTSASRSARSAMPTRRVSCRAPRRAPGVGHDRAEHEAGEREHRPRAGRRRPRRTRARARRRSRASPIRSSVESRNAPHWPGRPACAGHHAVERVGEHEDGDDQRARPAGARSGRPRAP